jgi:hypothetical protein
MKLYTEEQLINYLNNTSSIITKYDLELNNIPHIKLPSDEDIYEQAKTQSTFAPSFIYGAEWMRDKILK